MTILNGNLRRRVRPGNIKNMISRQQLTYLYYANKPSEKTAADLSILC